jgi:hypothetical protein
MVNPEESAQSVVAKLVPARFLRLLKVSSTKLSLNFISVDVSRLSLRKLSIVHTISRGVEEDTVQ